MPAIKDTAIVAAGVDAASGTIIWKLVYLNSSEPNGQPTKYRNAWIKKV